MNAPKTRAAGRRRRDRPRLSTFARSSPLSAWCYDCRVKRDGLMFELDGPGVTPESVDSLLLLRLADAWFKLVAKASEAGNIGLSFRGLRIRDKCVAVAV